MDIHEILAQLKEKFGDSFDISKVTEHLKGLDLKNLSLTDIISKLHADGLLSNLGNMDLNNVKGNVLDGLKEKAGNVLGGIFGK